MATICKGNTEFVTEHFRQSELYSTSIDAPTCIELDDRVIEALQYIRSYLDTPIIVTSTLRTPTGNALAGGSSNSQHLYGRAIDFTFPDDNYCKVFSFRQLMLQKGDFFQNLMELGVRGVGFYKDFVHIDVRPQEGLTTWDYSDNNFDSLNLNTETFFNQTPYDGPIACEIATQEYASDPNWIQSFLDAFGGGVEDGIAANRKPLTKLWVASIAILALGGYFIITSK